MSLIQASSSGRSTTSMPGPRSARAPSARPGPASTVTGSKRRTVRATSAQARSAEASAASVAKVGLGPGQAIQVRRCGAHSGGIRKPGGTVPRRDGAGASGMAVLRGSRGG